MSKLLNDRLIRALRRQTVDRTPAWIMRQAGRYMPEYRALRQQAGGDFLTLCKNPELACTVTMLPIKRFNLDAAILFSDILMLPEAMGLGLNFVADAGPIFTTTVNSASDVARLPDVDPEDDLGYVSASIKMIVKELDNTLPLIGFAGSPWTVAAYMVEGKTSKNFYKLKSLMYEQPLIMHKLLAHMTKQICYALQAQIAAGVNAVMIFDTWGGIIADPLYKEFSLRYIEEIVHFIKQYNSAIPITIYSKNGGRCLVEIASTGCDAIGLDWMVDIAMARSLVGDRVALQGNLDPCVLYASPERIVTEVKELLLKYGTGTGHIFNLGHGIPLDVNPDHVQVMLDAVQMYGTAA